MGYDIGHFQVELVEEGIVPHIAQKPRVRPLADRRATGRSGYQMSQRGPDEQLPMGTTC
jgi:hypothetical protein